MDLEEIRRKTDGHPIFETDFLRKFREGAYSKKQIAAFLAQQFWISRQFPQCLAVLYGRIEDVDAGFPLMRFLAVEHHGSTQEGAHWRLLHQTLRGFGLDPLALKAQKPWRLTEEFLATRMNFCLTKSVEEVLGAFAFAHELANESIFRAWNDGVKRVSGLPIGTRDYFETHIADEADRYLVLEGMMRTRLHQQGSMARVAFGASKMLSLRKEYFEGMDNRLSSM